MDKTLSLGRGGVTCTLIGGTVRGGDRMVGYRFH